MHNTYDGWIGLDAYDTTGDKVGEIEAIFYDDVTRRPEWVAIKSGLFGSRHSLVPIAGSSARGDLDDDDDEGLQLAYDAATINDAPKVDADGHLTPAEETDLYRYYGFDPDLEMYGDADLPRADAGYALGDAMTRSEQELTVSPSAVARTETGTARLRKYVVTETDTVDVPVTREEVRVVREPATGSVRPGDIGDDEKVVTLHETRPVVTTETVAKEKVRLETDEVTDTETVSADLRKERVEVEGDVDPKTTKARR